MQDIIDSQKKEFGKAFKELRVKLDFKKSDLAGLLDISDSTINNIETGKGFSSNSLYLIAYFFNLSASELLNINNSSYDIQEIKDSILHKSNIHFPDKYKAYIKKETLLTNRLMEMIKNTNFFNKAKVVDEIRRFLKNEYKVDFSSSVISKRMSHLESKNLIKSRAVDQNKKEYYK